MKRNEKDFRQLAKLISLGMVAISLWFTGYALAGLL